MPGSDSKASDFLVFSLGTGELQQGYRFEEVHPWGYLEWVKPMKGFPIGAIMSAGQSEAVSDQLSRMSGVRYVRLNGPLNGCAMAMDDASKKNLSCFARLADGIPERYDAAIEDVCRVLPTRQALALSAG